MLKIFKIKKGLFLTAILSILFCFNINAQTISDIIQTINLNSGIADSVLVSDMFYAENYGSIRLLNNPSVNVKFNFDNRKLIFTPRNDFEGMTAVDFKFGKDVYEIPVRVNKLQLITFTFKPDKKYGKVFLFGSFNSWLVFGDNFFHTF